MHVFGFTAGVSRLTRTAGSNLCLSERLTPGKMPTLTCSPKKKITICIKSNVCMTLFWWCYLFYSDYLSLEVYIECLHCFFFHFLTVHNVKPECLDAYNELWWVTVLQHINYVFKFVFTFSLLTFCQWGCVALHSCWHWIPLWTRGYLEHVVRRAGSGR